MEYYKELKMSREELLVKIQSMVKASRFQHMLAVEKVAGELAERFSADIYQARLAGLLHDYAKELSFMEFEGLIDRHHLDESLKSWGNEILHGKVGYLKIQEDLGLENQEILQAIERHTTGHAEMTVLDKIVYVADYIEKGRNFPQVDKARELAAVSLDKALAFKTMRTMEYLIAKKEPIYPQTLETYNTYIKFLKEK
ncbi:MAG: bis(5'-nucleosyl)-tetraphosphatase (symmetrical) YqeK [Lactovum sp.]